MTIFRRLFFSGVDWVRRMVEARGGNAKGSWHLSTV